MPSLEAIDPRQIGRRIAEARKARGRTQEEAAGFLGCSRPTYIAIEKGERPVRPDELVKLAGFLGRKVHELVRSGEPVTDFQPHLRAAAERAKGGRSSEGLDAAIDELQRLVEDYRELERMADALRPSFPPEVALNPRIDPVAQAEVAADRERSRLGLGDQPVPGLRATLEWETGVRIFQGDSLPSRVAGMYAYSDELGACIVVNRKHPAERRRASIAHEYAHFLLAEDRYRPGIDYLAAPGRKPANERFAESFAMAFLMPSASVRRRFQEVIAATGDFQVADLCRLKHFFGVSLEALTLRLEHLGLVPRGTWDGLRDAGLSPQKAEALLGLPPRSEDDAVVPERYRDLAVRAFERGDLGDADLAYYLRTDVASAREEARRLATSRETGPGGEERMIRLDLPHSLLGLSQ